MSLLKSISESFNEFLNKECEIENFEQKYINESTELSAGKTKELLAKINAGEFGKIKYIIVNSTPEKYQVANNKNVKDVDKLTDKDIPNIIAFIKSDGKLAAYANEENASILETVFGLKDVKISGNKFVKNPESGVYEYSFKGKGGLDAEKTLDEEVLNFIFGAKTIKKLWLPIDNDLAALLKSPKTKKIETTSISPNYELYALGAFNTKTNLSLDAILNGEFDDVYKSWKIADTLVVNRIDKKYLSISNKLDKGVITIGGIPINEIRRAFKEYNDIDERLGIDSTYISLLKKMLIANNPIEVKEKFVKENAQIDEATLGEFLTNLCASIYRFGYVITETSTSGKINNWYPVNNDYVSDIQITGCKFSVLSEKKKKSLKLPEAKKGNVWTLGFKIEFTMHGRKYTWDFRDHIGNGSLTVATIKRD